MTFRNLDKEWDEVLILDLLSEQERKDHRISEDLVDALMAEGYGTRRTYCDSKSEVLAALEDAFLRTNERSFMIHFTAHGCTAGIGNNSGMELIQWQELRGPLTKINTAMNGDLIVNMIACKGIHGLKIDNLIDPESAYYALIGPMRDLTFKEARCVTQKFYGKLANNPQIPLVVKEIIQEEGLLIWAKSSQELRGKTLSISTEGE